jgi:hypothetical protein
MVIEPIVFTGVNDEVVYRVFKEDATVTSIVVEKDANRIILNFDDLNAAVSKAYIR